MTALAESHSVQPPHKEQEGNTMALHVTSDNLASLMRHPAAQRALAAVARNAELRARNEAPGSEQSAEEAAYAQAVADVLACLTGEHPAEELCWTLGIDEAAHD